MTQTACLVFSCNIPEAHSWNVWLLLYLHMRLQAGSAAGVIPLLPQENLELASQLKRLESSFSIFAEESNPNQLLAHLGRMAVEFHHLSSKVQKNEQRTSLLQVCDMRLWAKVNKAQNKFETKQLSCCYRCKIFLKVILFASLSIHVYLMLRTTSLWLRNGQSRTMCQKETNHFAALICELFPHELAYTHKQYSTSFFNTFSFCWVHVGTLSLYRMWITLWWFFLIPFVFLKTLCEQLRQENSELRKKMEEDHHIRNRDLEQLR